MTADSASKNTVSSRRRESILERRMAGIPAALLLSGILLLAALLRFINLSAVGEGNLYYAAAVKSMLASPENFFFAAAEPGGSVTVDKPPLGLWVQAVSAAVFGVNTFGLMLPQILAGLGSVVMVYVLVKRWFGEGAGLLGALILAVTPVSVAVERNNTMDALLIFTLLLAVWAFVQAAERSPWWLLAGGLLIGLAFNIKMLQAFLPVPAMFMYYLLAAKQGWLRRLLYMLLAGLVILVISFSWVVIVDSIPEENRPYIGSSENNTVMELIFGHNGLNRLFGRQGADALLSGLNGGDPDGSPAAASAAGGLPPRGGQGAVQPPQGSLPPRRPGTQGPAVPGGTGLNNPSAQDNPPAADGVNPPPGGAAGRSPDGGIGNQEIGETGLDRLFTLPLANEISWLLPFGLGMLLVLLFSSPLRFPLERGWQSLLLWGGWLLTCVVFFSLAAFFHAYYLAMLAPPLAAVIAAGMARLWEIHKTKPWLASGILWLLASVTFAYQVYTAGLYTGLNAWTWAAGASLAGGILFGVAGNLLPRGGGLRKAGIVLAAAGLLAAPLVWSVRTTLEENPHTGLPGAWGGENSTGRQGPGDSVDQNGLYMLDYLEANTEDMEYMLAVPSSMQGASYVLATGRPVLYLGGFNGGDPVLEFEAFRELVAEGDLRYVLLDGGAGRNSSNADIFRWVAGSCADVSEDAGASHGIPERDRRVLFDCSAE